MKNPENNNPLHGITLQTILEQLEANYGFEMMFDHVNIKCFGQDPSIKSSLIFLRKTDWARKKVENLYLEMLQKRRTD